MSGGQDEASEQIETSEQKIDQRLIRDEMLWRGKEVEVRNHPGGDWTKRVFHTAIANKCYCLAEPNRNYIDDWTYARPIEKKWRVPTDEDVIAYIHKHGKRPACRVRDFVNVDWKEGYLSAVDKSEFIRFNVIVDDSGNFFQFCEIEDET